MGRVKTVCCVLGYKLRLANKALDLHVAIRDCPHLQAESQKASNAERVWCRTHLLIGRYKRFYRRGVQTCSNRRCFKQSISVPSGQRLQKPRNFL